MIRISKRQRANDHEFAHIRSEQVGGEYDAAQGVHDRVVRRHMALLPEVLRRFSSLHVSNYQPDVAACRLSCSVTTMSVVYYYMLCIYIYFDEIFFVSIMARLEELT